MPNHLIQETSPYLLQHAHNPVDWYPWGEEAFQKAHSENKPLFISIGYAACHWCHVMEHESFENRATADLLNSSFVSIKVDREERPDVDMVYMQAVQNLTGQGGWPLNVFTTPEGQPFYGGTYFPPAPRYGMPAFPDLLAALAKLWRQDPSKILMTASQVSQQVATETYWSGQNQEGALKADILHTAISKLVESYDWERGGWGGAPKFPAPMAIEFLLSQAARGDADALKVASHVLKAMQRGGMYDVVGGGFHRYSTDENWLVPHFEKMLYDNAQLSLAYLHAYQVTGEVSFRETAQDTLDFILRELTDSEGGFYSSLDADSEGEEGKYYTWTVDELKEAAGSPENFDLLASFCNIPPGGNFEGKIILQRKDDTGNSHDSSKESAQQNAARLRRCLDMLSEARSRRPRPATDSKILVSWNALAIQALAQAAARLARPDYLAAAQKCADFILTHHLMDGNLYRSWRIGSPRANATLEDYAILVTALLDLYQADFNPRWFQAAAGITEMLVSLFEDPAGGFFLVRQDQHDLIVRPKDLQDNVTPSGNSATGYALLKMARYTGNNAWLSLAEKALQQVQDFFGRYPQSFPYWLSALDFAIGPVNQIALVYPAGSLPDLEIISNIQRQYLPRSILAVSNDRPDPGSPEILHDRTAISGKSTLYICHGFVCDLPLTDRNSIDDAIQGLRGFS